MSYTTSYYHIIFCTYKSEQTIPIKHEKELYAYIQGWGREYAGFSYSLRDKEMIVGYIMRQKEHHRVTTFAGEYSAFLMENGIAIDERYFLNDTL